jgi:hypothetical protein
MQHPKTSTFIAALLRAAMNVDVLGCCIGAHARPINWIGRPHISAFDADGILTNAIFLRSIIVWQAAAQVKEALRRGERGLRLSIVESSEESQSFL